MCLLAAAGGCGSMMAAARNAEGVRLYQQTRYQESIEQFHKALNSDPDNADSYYNLAAVYHRLGTVNKSESELKQAENYYNMCRDRNPDHADCYRGLAVLMIEQGRTEEAFRLVEGWADRRPDLAAPRIELARLFEEFGDSKAAEEHLVAALGVDHDNDRALAALGQLRERMGNHAQAVVDYERSLLYNRFQPEVEARVAALRSALNPTQMMTTPGGTLPSAAGAASGGTQIATGAAAARR